MLDNQKVLQLCMGQLQILLALVISFLHIVKVPNLESTNQDHGNSLLQNSRKRSRARHTSLFQLIWKYQNNIETYLHLHREISCPWYIKPRTRQWFLLYSDYVITEDPDRFKLFFRISPLMFYHVCELVHDLMVTNPPKALARIPNKKLLVSRQVAIAIRRLSTGDQMLGIGELFGVSCSTVSKVTWKFIQALNIRGRGLIKWPTGSDLESVKAGFLKRGFPGCCGAVDGTHFPVELPKSEQSQDYFDFKHNIFVSMQAIVDQNLKFLDVIAGWPSSIQDTRLLRNSSFYNDVVYRNCKLNGKLHVCRNGENVREYILGDAGYPVFDWLIVPYPKGQGAREDDWNFEHSSTRMCVERAFGRLKGCWRILSRILWKPRKEMIGPMIFSCCILHNIMIERGEVVNPTDIEFVTPHPRGYGPVGIPTREYFEGGPETRDALLDEVLDRHVRRRRV